MNLEYWDIFVTVVLLVVIACWIVIWLRAKRKMVYPRGVYKWYALCAALFTITSVIRLKIAKALEKADLVPFYILLAIGIIACMCIFYSILKVRQDMQDSEKK